MTTFGGAKAKEKERSDGLHPGSRVEGSEIRPVKRGERFSSGVCAMESVISGWAERASRGRAGSGKMASAASRVDLDRLLWSSK